MITKSETIRLKQIIDYIKENADEIKAQTEITEIEFGELIGYAEALTIIQDMMAGYDVDADIGLDFDIDAEYLGVSVKQKKCVN